MLLVRLTGYLTERIVILLGTYIILSNLTSRASTWNNNTDLVQTCDVSQFTNMTDAFNNNTAFNQDLSAWDTSDGTYMFRMFLVL